jgi:hypothetical protein
MAPGESWANVGAASTPSGSARRPAAVTPESETTSGLVA